MQRFVQDPGNPGVLYNHDNEYLHYGTTTVPAAGGMEGMHGIACWQLGRRCDGPFTSPAVIAEMDACFLTHRFLPMPVVAEDDWYVVGWEPDSYAFIVYKGQNDAWKGYGGATVYTRFVNVRSRGECTGQTLWGCLATCGTGCRSCCHAGCVIAAGPPALQQFPHLTPVPLHRQSLTPRMLPHLQGLLIPTRAHKQDARAGEPSRTEMGGVQVDRQLVWTPPTPARWYDRLRAGGEWSGIR